jgi:hypothetical protein
MITTPSGAQFEISVDGKPRSYRGTKAAAPFATASRRRLFAAHQRTVLSFRGRLAKLKYDGGRPLRP